MSLGVLQETGCYLKPAFSRRGATLSPTSQKHPLTYTQQGFHNKQPPYIYNYL